MSASTSSPSADKGKGKDPTCVSLPEHLRDVLVPLSTLVAAPEDLRVELEPFVKPVEQSDSKPKEIPYDLLQRVSRWAQSPAGKVALKDASLDPTDYMMISLLAGLVTAPSAVLPPYSPPPTTAQTRRDAVKDRRAIIALVNALFSVIGVGVATWKAGQTTNWTNGVRVLCALFAALVVAIAEGGLYLIYTSRTSATTSTPTPHSSKKRVAVPIVSLQIPVREQELDSSALDSGTEGESALADGLRRRLPASGSEDGASLPP